MSAVLIVVFIIYFLYQFILLSLKIFSKTLPSQACFTLNYSTKLKIKRPTYFWLYVDMIQLQNSEDCFLNAEISTLQRRIACKDDTCLTGADWAFEKRRTRNVDQQQSCIFVDLEKHYYSILKTWKRLDHSLFYQFSKCRWIRCRISADVNLALDT